VLRSHELIEEARSYLPEADVDRIHRAYLLAASVHEGQQRASGEPYVTHPIAVARILAGFHMDGHCLTAALLHDAVEDTPASLDQIREQFGDEVAGLVDGVTKLGQVHFETREEAQAENFRKMLLAMSQDLRVIIIKLADRLHNMRTLGYLSEGKQRRVGRETLEIFAPIAHRLGLNQIKNELEDLSFKYLYPRRFKVLAEEVRKERGNRAHITDRIEVAITKDLEEAGIQAQVLGREKHLYSIYRKMQKKGLSFEEVQDIYAFRILVDDVPTCYQVLGRVHNLFKPIPGRFKDYIAIPKANGYQSLHTVVVNPFGGVMEFQIRTQEMQEVAEAGVAAHWRYKVAGSEPPDQRKLEQSYAWLQQLLQIQQEAGDSAEFLEHVKVDLFPDEVYVFTPKGEIMRLPRGATPVDFAYAVHTEIGHQCVGARVNGRITSLRTPVRNGDRVEILTDPDHQPTSSWLHFVVTGKARSAIRHFLKTQQREKSVALGRGMLERTLEGIGVPFAEVPDSALREAAEQFHLSAQEALYEAIGRGTVLAPAVVQHLFPGYLDRDSRVPGAPAAGPEEGSEQGAGNVLVKGMEGIVANLARCCYPIPRDPIVGFISVGRGVMVHREDCPNLHELAHHPEKWVTVEWAPEIHGAFPVAIHAVVRNTKGVLANLASAIAEDGANIDHVQVEDRDGVHKVIGMTLEVEGRDHLAHLMRFLRGLDAVERIVRKKG
jgi:GTP pyrophosphokinase/guanosine-3',5'-bis(diphosphate) 3'-pyrophosphohydrolase